LEKSSTLQLDKEYVMGRHRMSHCSGLTWYSLKFESLQPDNWSCCMTKRLMFMKNGPLIIVYELRPIVLCF
jgi:hypothetical protein